MHDDEREIRATLQDLFSKVRLADLLPVCGAYIPGHHAGYCALRQGHSGHCSEDIPDTSPTYVNKAVRKISKLILEAEERGARWALEQYRPSPCGLCYHACLGDPGCGLEFCGADPVEICKKGREAV
jgi:hypothetical protein